MRKILVFILVSLSYSCSNKEPLPSIIDTPEEEQCPSCIWNDEFNGSSINTDNWNFETGYGSNGWGNDEWQLYTNNNAKISDGNLIISAKKESSTIGKRNGSITSSRLTTQGKVTIGPGMRIEARIKGPWGQGMWPAFWTLGSNFPIVGWPACGEIDILEYAGGNPLSNENNKINIFLQKSKINNSIFIDLIEGFILDQQKIRIQNKEELIKYSYHVAGTVGLMMSKIIGVKHEKAAKSAIDLGIGMQLTNIARDVYEDSKMKRIYLPAN